MFLDEEKKTLAELKKAYKAALNDINLKLDALMVRQDADMQHVIYQIEYQKQLKTQVQSILEQLQSKEFETLSKYLTNSYTNGYVGTMYDIAGQGIPLITPIDNNKVLDAIKHQTKLSENLYTTLGHDIKALQKNISAEISRGISTGLSYGEIARNIKNSANIPQNRAMTIARTEAHRIQCKATADAQKVAKSKGADVLKQWAASLDGATRETHRKLDGQIREIDELFEVGGKKAKYPGGFGDPAEDCNCRCALLQRARWSLDDEELDTLKERAEYFGIDKSKDFRDYKDKYLKAVESERVRINVPKKNNQKGLAFDVQFFSESEEHMKKRMGFIGKLRNGEVNLSIRKQKQNEHIPNTLERKRRIEEDKAKGRTPSSELYEDVDIQDIIKNYAGKGTIMFNPNNDYPKEYVTIEKNIGKVYNIGKETYEDTDIIEIAYS